MAGSPKLPEIPQRSAAALTHDDLLADLTMAPGD